MGGELCSQYFVRVAGELGKWILGIGMHIA